ncbi:MAG: DnaJ domain-containing protein [Gammaproteobacteria bacterium]|nr:DnaJ domain-containing protein [Gammaproteobacteria bacterium]NIR83997.1 DnaJ domain-containing protein [Gammaproteobacteria bacterium]NIR89141.1 DnaJ domain-containing protein [Gammaproteobacteria bacterium]NIU04943.1 DnaJ domain-containing protein [Gammaproteobacteria bacterium]NIV52109.1 DnaJ domain-containing protein [Gammaproteobacteria bacterium]
MKFKDYYNVMGISRDATQEEIKRAYRKLARRYHPDVSKEPDAEERFKEVGEAYEVLKDPQKRAAYDRLARGRREGEEFRPPPDWDAGFEFSGGGFTDAGTFSDFFESLFGRMRGFGRPYGGLRMKGEDLYARVRISLEDAYHGTTRRVALQVPESDTEGHVTLRTRTLKVRIPPGVTEGQRIRLAGEGGPGVGGGPQGDLFLEVELEPHRLFRTSGRDVILSLPVAPWEAALGRTVTVPTLGGRVSLKIPPESQSGRRLRLKGRGLPGTPPGDQYVVLRLVIPRADTPEARAFYREMEERMPLEPRAELES